MYLTYSPVIYGTVGEIIMYQAIKFWRIRFQLTYTLKKFKNPNFWFSYHRMLREFEYCNGIVLIIDVVVVIIFIIFWEESNSCKATWTCYRKTRQLAYFCHLFFILFWRVICVFNFCVLWERTVFAIWVCKWEKGF